MSRNDGPLFATLGMFIIDEFEYKDDDGNPTGKIQKSQVGIPWGPFHRKQETNGCFFFLLQIGGGGTYAIIGARMW